MQKIKSDRRFNPRFFNPRFVAGLAFTGILTAAMLFGCESAAPPANAAAATVASTQPSFALFGPPPKKSGVQLWSENCARCHNGRPPEEFNGQQWTIIVHHMRLRANLTGEEARQIAGFLQAKS